MSDAVVDLLARRPPAADDEPERLHTLLELLDRPDRAVPTVWVTGSHGRSSVIAMTAALFAALDVTAGTSTRPHLQDLRERIRIAGAVIERPVLAEQLEYLAPFLGEVDVRFPAPLRFDEVIFALACTWFADAPVDVAVHEDAPVTSGRVELLVDLDPRRGALLRGPDGAEHAAGDAFGVAAREVAVGGQRLALRGVTGTVPDVYLPLHGAHQAANAAVALAAVEAFLGFAGALDVDLIRTAFASVRLPGRMEVVRRTDAASVLLDGARDAAGAAALAAALEQEFAVRHRIGVVAPVGGDPAAVLEPLAATLDHVVVADAPAPDAPPADEVAAATRAAGLPVEVAETLEQALEQATGLATAEDVVVVLGGLQTAGAARRALSLDAADDVIDTG
jgi:dihydrofolate synthase/folylpolyglutamate synthase